MIKIGSVLDLYNALENHGAHKLRVTNKSDCNTEYMLAYQYFFNTTQLCYLAFIDKKNLEIDYLSDDPDECEIESMLIDWEIELINNRE